MTKRTNNPRWRQMRNAKIRREYRRQTARSLGHEYGLSIRQIYRIVGGH